MVINEGAFPFSLSLRTSDLIRLFHLLCRPGPQELPFPSENAGDTGDLKVHYNKALFGVLVLYIQESNSGSTV